MSLSLSLFWFCCRHLSFRHCIGHRLARFSSLESGTSKSRTVEILLAACPTGSTVPEGTVFPGRVAIKVETWRGLPYDVDGTNAVHGCIGELISTIRGVRAQARHEDREVLSAIALPGPS
ncbi:hypothetical protein BJ170DRAFT_598046 [Xylariales sp. AK1849]|nr:hypothetical protein BJ170DRAFT_598046 [Xylariales sp. AK1849]